MNDRLRPDTRRVWPAVAIVTAAILFLGTFSHLLNGLLMVLAGILFGVFLWRVSYYLAGLTGSGQRIALGLAAIVLVPAATGALYLMGGRIRYKRPSFRSNLRPLLPAPKRSDNSGVGGSGWKGDTARVRRFSCPTESCQPPGWRCVRHAGSNGDCTHRTWATSIPRWG
jgi:hypothetical protein